MNANEYQELANRTLVDKAPVLNDQEMMLVWNAIGLAGEAGEVADTLKKAIFHKHGLNLLETRLKLKKELGDVLWYVAVLSTVLGYSLDTIMELNIAKLRQRYPNGFTSADSMNRTDLEVQL